MGTTLLPKTKQKTDKNPFPFLESPQISALEGKVMDMKDHPGRMSRERTDDLGERS